MAARPTVLAEPEVAAGLRELPEWVGDVRAVRRSADLPSFAHAVAAVVRIAAVAEEMDHHPDVDVRWRTLRFTLTTHSAGGVTELDLRLAHRVDAVLAEVSALPDGDVALPEPPP